MNIKYKITDYFEKNNLFDNNIANGITIKKDSKILTIKGTSRDLIEFADLLANLALEKNKDSHIHLDDLTFLNEESDFSEIILEKE